MCCQTQKATIGHIQRREGLYVPIVLFLIFRLVTFLATHIFVVQQPGTPPPWVYWNVGSATCDRPIVAQQPGSDIINPWCRFDTAWYLKNALEGYHVGNPGIVFPPLYPLLIRGLASITGQFFLSSLLVSNAACLAVFVLLYDVIEIEFKVNDVARRTVILLAVFPSAFYLLSGYSESLYVALTLAAFLTAMKRRWWMVGAFALLASLDRAQGLVLCLPLGWMLYEQFRPTGLNAMLRRLPAVLAPVAGVFGYRLYVALSHIGSIDAAYASEWRIYTRLPFEALQSYIMRLVHGQTLPYENNNALVLVLIFSLSILVTLKLKLTYSLYVWGTLGIILLRYHEGPQFEGMFRYALTFFPCFIVGGMLLKRWWTFVPCALAALSWQLILLENFIHWIWVA